MSIQVGSDIQNNVLIEASHLVASVVNRRALDLELKDPKAQVEKGPRM